VGRVPLPPAQGQGAPGSSSEQLKQVTALYKSTPVRRAAHLQGSLATVRPELCKVDLHNLLLLLQEPFLDFWQSDPSARAYAMGGIIGLLTQLQRRGLAGPAADVSRDVRLGSISPRCALTCTSAKRLFSAVEPQFLPRAILRGSHQQLSDSTSL
jgi:hypothetical protein